MSAPFRFPRFFVTSPNPCPYLPGKFERKVFTELSGAHASELNDALGRIGFRRSQSVAYRPSCPDCNACVSLRVIADEFEPNGTQKRILKRNRDLEVIGCRPWSTDEQFQLLRKYLASRHPGGGMSNMDEMDYAYYAGLLGKATKNLPVKLVNNENDTYNDNFTWTLNSNGYPISLEDARSITSSFDW